MLILNKLVTTGAPAISCMTQLIKTSRLLHFSIDWWYLFDIFYIESFHHAKWFIHFYFQLAGEIEPVQTF